MKNGSKPKSQRRKKRRAPASPKYDVDKLNSLPTKSAKIRYLDSLGLKRDEIAAILEVRYEYVCKVLITPDPLTLIPQGLENLPEKMQRRLLAAWLTQRGFPITEQTLAKGAWDGTGPPFEIWGRVALYKPMQALEWARNRLHAPQPRGVLKGRASKPRSRAAATTA